MVEEALEKVNQALDDFYAGKLKDRNQLMKEWISFLDVLTKASKTADAEQKEHYRKLLSHLANKLAQGMLILKDKAGLSESDLTKVVENPNNFAPKVWGELSELKANLDQRMQVLLPLLLEGDEGKPPPKKKKPSPGKSSTNERRRKRRSGWISS